MVVAKHAVLEAVVVDAAVDEPGGRRYLSPEDPGNGITETLGAKTGATFTKTEALVKEDFSSPENCKIRSLAKTDEEEPVVLADANPKEVDRLAMVCSFDRFNAGDDVRCEWEVDFPMLPSVEVS